MVELINRAARGPPHNMEVDEAGGAPHRIPSTRSRWTMTDTGRRATSLVGGGSSEDMWAGEGCGYSREIRPGMSISTSRSGSRRVTEASMVSEPPSRPAQQLLQRKCSPPRPGVQQGAVRRAARARAMMLGGLPGSRRDRGASLSADPGGPGSRGHHREERHGPAHGRGDAGAQGRGRRRSCATRSAGRAGVALTGRTPRRSIVACWRGASRAIPR